MKSNARPHPTKNTLIYWAICLVVSFLVITSCIWLCLMLWFHRPLGELLSLMSISTISLIALIGLAFFGARLRYQKFLGIYVLCFLAGLVYFLYLIPTNDKQWQPEVARLFSFSQNGNEISIHQVRDFAWRTEKNYDINWETRTYHLDKLVSADLIISDWGLNKIVHTMVSFGFSDGQYLTFSIETRKEKREEYSALGGFFRQYELLFIAGDEKDLIYTRSNVRGEKVYLYPIVAEQSALQALFLQYLNTGQALHDQPKWYNTLFSNCTTVIYQLIETIAPNALPKDYRILMAGQLPSYLHENHLLDNRHTLSEWQQLAYINHKTQSVNIGTPSKEFSRLIRE